MPTFNQSQSGRWFVTHSFSNDFEHVTRHYKLTDDCAEELLDEGFKNGSSLPVGLFHELRLAGRIYTGEPPLYATDEVNRQREITAKANRFFESLDEEEISRNDALEVFRRELLSPLNSQPRALEIPMLEHFADRIQARLQLFDEDWFPLLSQLREAVLAQTPKAYKSRLEAFFLLPEE